MATTVQTPASINYYNVRLHEFIAAPGETAIKIWENPYVTDTTEIPCFIPKCSRQTTEFFKKVIDNAHLGSVFFLEPFKGVLVVLELKDLMSFCTASKCCYIAGKSDSVWQQKISFTFSKLTCIPEAKCRYSPEQQFQIAFKELQYRQRPYLCQYNHNLEKSNHKIPHIGLYEEHMNATEIRVGKARVELKRLIDLFGRTCVGTVESIEPQSEQGRCLAALNLIHGEINDQEAFKLMIQQSEVGAMNAAKAKVEPGKVEDVPSGYCGMGPDDDYHFLAIEKIFGSVSSPLTDEEVCSALSAFENIQSWEVKMKAFTLILINNQLTDEIATSFYEALPEALQNRLKDEMHILKTDQLCSQHFKDAAFQVYVNLKRTG